MKLRIVADTNILLSGILYESGNEAQILGLFLEEKAILLASLDTLEELREALTRPKFKLTPTESLALFQIILSKSEILLNVEEAAEKCRDKDDQKFLDLAHTGSADYLLTGDRDLLEMQKVGTTRILTSAQLIRQSGKSERETLPKLKPSVREKHDRSD